jgi:hypothetical protein
MEIQDIIDKYIVKAEALETMENSSRQKNDKPGEFFCKNQRELVLEFIKDLKNSKISYKETTITNTEVESKFDNDLLLKVNKKGSEGYIIDKILTEIKSNTAAYFITYRKI